jgi:unsaturated rhamnogalacturonyl hydrolase
METALYYFMLGGRARRARAKDGPMQSSNMRARVGPVVTAAGLLLPAVAACSNGNSSNGGGSGGATAAGAGSAGTHSSAGMSSSSSGTGGASSGTGGSGGSMTMSSGGASGMTHATAGGTNGGSAGASGGGAPAKGGGGGTSGGAGSGTGGAANGGAAGAAATANWCLPISAHPQGVDWAKALVDSQIKANVALTWQYPDGLFLHGVYLAYKRLNDASYLALMKKWADANTAGKSTYDSLDDMQPTLVLDDMFRETMDAKYKAAPAAAATRLETGNYPTTGDGGYWHNTGATQQLWGDGVFMDLPPLVNQGELFKDTKAIDIATQQLIIYDSHLAAPNNLHKHQWDGSAMKQSCCEWCRAEGWYEMALLMVLDFAGPTHKDYDALVAIVQRLAKGVAATQDAATGRWWQVMDTPTDSGNWLETSCTAMHTYFLSKAAQKGYIDAATYGPLAVKGFNGEMQMVSNASSVQIKNICPGTSVLASAADYYARPPATNDNHGLGAFLLMYDQLTCR